MDHTVYKNAKESSEEYNVSKKKLFAELQDKGFGQWMNVCVRACVCIVYQQFAHNSPFIQILFTLSTHNL